MDMVICFSRSDTWYIPFQVVVCESFHLYACKQKHQASPEPYRISGLNFAIHPLIIMIYKHLVTFAFGAFAQQTVTAIGKFSCGRLRPHFFDGCRPDFSQFNCTGTDGLPAYVTNFECTGTDQKVLDDIRWVLTHCSIVTPYVGRTWSPLMEVMTYYTPPPPKVEWGPPLHRRWNGGILDSPLCLYTPLSWMILSKQKNLHLFSSQYICVFSKTSVRAWFVC